MTFTELIQERLGTWESLSDATKQWLEQTNRMDEGLGDVLAIAKTQLQNALEESLNSSPSNRRNAAKHGDRMRGIISDVEKAIKAVKHRSIDDP